MSTIEADAPTLFDLLARRWTVTSPVVATIFSRDSATLAFIGADGKLWRTPTIDPEAPTRRFRMAADTGRATISPRRKAVPPLSTSALDDEATCMTAWHDHAFAVGCRSGRVLAMSPTGRFSALGKETDRIDGLASTRQGQAVFAASGGKVSRYPSSGAAAEVLTSTTGDVAAFAVRPDAGSLAWIDAQGLHVWASDVGHLLDDSALCVEAAGALAWSPCGRWLAIARGRRELVLIELDEGRVAQTMRLPDYPAHVSALSWNTAGDLVATNGAFRIVAWDVGRLRTDPNSSLTTRQTGRLGHVAVSAVAFHPRSPLVAAGYENGSVVVAKVGGSDELVVRDISAGRPTTMCWSDDGNHLAFGTSAGEAIVATFPATFFK